MGKQKNPSELYSESQETIHFEELYLLDESFDDMDQEIMDMLRAVGDV